MHTEDLMIERNKNLQINSGINKALSLWKDFPDERVCVEMVGAFLEQGMSLGLGLTIEIDGKTLKGEGSRAILKGDLERMARKKNGSWIFMFRKSKEAPTYRIFPTSGYLEIMDRHFGAIVPAAFIEPSQINSINFV